MAAMGQVSNQWLIGRDYRFDNGYSEQCRNMIQNCPLTRKSKSGGAIFHGPHLVHQWCKQQSRVAKSSAEAEFLSMSRGLEELFGLRNVAEWLLMHTYPLKHTHVLIKKQGEMVIR